MRLRTVTIRAFRGFGKEARITLGDTNVFTGPNGYGKTSFFDAIHWSLFGHIPRFSGTRDFSRAGDVFQNKFHHEPYSVTVDFESDSGEQLRRKRTADTCLSELNGKTIDDEDFLRRLGLGSPSEDKFLRYFLLQQEKIDEFVKDLNPRSRYDSMVSLLQFSVPEILSDRLEGLSKELTSSLEAIDQTLSNLSSRLQTLKSDIHSLYGATGDLSIEVINKEYATLLADSQRVRKAIRFEDDSDIHRLPASLPTLVDRLNSTLRELNLLASKVLDLRKLTTLSSPAPGGLQNRISELSDGIDRTERQLKDLEANEAISRQQLERADQNLDDAKRSNNRIMSLLAEIKGIVSSDICPVCQRPIQKDSLVSIIDSAIGQQSEQLAQLIEARDASQQTLLTVQAGKERLKKDLQSIISERSQLQGDLDNRKRFESEWKDLSSSPAARQFGLDGEDLEAFDMKLTQLMSEVSDLHRRALDVLHLAERLSNATTLLPRKDADLKETQAAFDRASRQQASFTGVRQMLNKCASAVSETRTNLVTETLEGNKPLMRNIYTRLQPHPLFTQMDFEVVRAYKEAELYFRVLSRDHKITAYPSTLFSASQLNALAVCIFIALSLRSVGPLKLMMLDDPVQSMDDINVLGLSDVLRQLKSRRQLFISTHNRDFYRLLLNKLRPVRAEDKVRGFRFEAWSNDGPTIQEESVDFVDIKINIGEMASLIGSSSA
jgi:DNA repair exonuclease SbcCD ATPase subunit